MTTQAEPVNTHTTKASVHLDAFRGVAAMLVFLGHGRELFLSGGIHAAIAGKAHNEPGLVSKVGDGAHVIPAPFAATTSIGHQAVILFFVLSGFFVGGSVINAFRAGRFSWGSYLTKRLTRLWVALIPTLFLGWAIDVAGMHLFHGMHTIYNSPLGQNEVGPGLIHRVSFAGLLGNAAFLQGIVVQPFGTNVSLWSLAYEFWFYLFFPLLLLIFLSRVKRWRFASGALLVAALLFCGRDIALYFVIWLFGALVATTPLTLSTQGRRLVVAGCSAILLVAMAFELKHAFNLYVADIVLAVLYSALVWGILHYRAAAAATAYSRASKSLSSMSYTLYLTHMPIFVFINALLMPVWKPWPAALRSIGTLFAVYVFVFAVCSATYFCFERNTDAVRRFVIGLRGRSVASGRSVLANCATSPASEA